VRGTVVFGGNSRVLMQFADDALQVYYVLEVVNSARNRVDIGGPLVIDLPPGTSGATPLEGSSPSVTVAGNRITVAGPFASGTTPVQVATGRRTTAAPSRWRSASRRLPAGHGRRAEDRRALGGLAAVRRDAGRHHAGRQGVRARSGPAWRPARRSRDAHEPAVPQPHAARTRR
jgi:hypothetical protein